MRYLIAFTLLITSRRAGVPRLVALAGVAKGPAIGFIADWLVLLGFNRWWQYIYNFASLMSMPFLLAGALLEKVFEKKWN